MTSSKPKILLVNPHYPYGFQVPTIAGKLFGKWPLANVVLPTLAALVPDDFDVQIVDTAVEEIDFDTPCDLVGLTGYHSHVSTARALAQEFRRRGKLVVVGGPSVSISPERWRDCADVLVHGEAERIWPKFLRDFANGKHETEYRDPEKVDIALAPLPRYDLLKTNRYLLGITQTSRGCPFECEFCDVIVYLGRRIRYKPVEHVVAELQQCYDIGWRMVLLADDNLTVNRRDAYEMLDGIRKWNAKQKQPMLFYATFSIDAARDSEMLKLVAAAGITRVFIGIETPNKESLKETLKRQNVHSDMLADVRKIEEHGIAIIGGSIVGFDHDTIDIFRQQLEFFQQTGIPVVNPYMLQALDGTPLKERMQKAGRYIDPARYDELKVEEGLTFPDAYGMQPTVYPAGMSLKDLEEGFTWMVRQLYHPDNYLQRARNLFEALEHTPKSLVLKYRFNRISGDELHAMWKLLLYFLKTKGAERKLWKEIVKLGMKSTFPHRLNFTAWLLLMYASIKNNADELFKIDILDLEATANAPYPVGHKPKEFPAPDVVTRVADKVSLGVI